MQRIDSMLQSGWRAAALGLLALTLFPGCVTVTATSTVSCASASAGTDDDGPGGPCTKTALAKGAPVPTNAIPINGPGPIPPGAVCNAPTGNNKCANPGMANCSFNTALTCKDTYNMVTTKCNCACM
jgi:hypothetical protein